MRMHASRVSLAMNVYVMLPPPPTHFDYLFFVLYLFYQFRRQPCVF